MKILMYGLNQDTVSIDEDIICKFENEDKGQHLKKISSFQGVEEVLIFHSQYRIEYYLHVDEKEFQHGDLLRYISDYTQKPLNDVILEMYSLFNEDAVRHLFELAVAYYADKRGNLRNLALLEESLAFANNQGTLGSVIEALFAHVIIFSYQSKMIPNLAPLILDPRLSFIKRLTISGDDLNKYKALMIGREDQLRLISKIFSANNIQSLTLAVNSVDSLKGLGEELQHFMSCPYLNTSTKLQITDYHHMAYWFEAADIIVGADQKAITEFIESQDDSLTIRQTPKQQVYVNLDLAEKSSEEIVTDHYSLINEPKEAARSEYTDEEINEAESFLEELLSQEIHQFMSEYFIKTQGN